jgi:hypothetical protein
MTIHLFKYFCRKTKADLIDDMKRLTLLLLLAAFSFSSFGQKKVTLSGYIKDKKNGEGLIGSTVYVEELKSGTNTNIYGFYSFSLEPGTYTITFSYIGYEPIVQKIDLSESQTVNIELNEDNVALGEVVVSGERKDQNVTSIEMSVEKMDIKTIKKIPQFMGEADIVRSALLLPGVTSVGEGASGFNVRGGNIDQNLILLDEAPVYNSSHLFGFFSVFNPDAVKDFTLYKGGIPAQYGGRLSSVMDVHQKEGNIKSFTGAGNVSLVSSKLTLEGPLQKNKSSFMVAGRRSYADLAAKAAGQLKKSDAYFYDLNLKVNYILNDNNRVFLSAYIGSDVFNFDEAFESQWGNTTTSLRWNHLFSSRLFSNLNLVYSDYSYSLGVPTGSFAFEWESHIYNYNLKYDFTLFANPNNTTKFGVNSILYRFHPGKAGGTGDESVFNDIEIEKEHAWEPAIYLSNEQKVNSRLTLQYGLRYSQFINFGPGEENEYATGKPLSDPSDPNSVNEVTGVTKYDRMETIKAYDGLEPRLAVNYLLNDRSSIKTSYNRTRQYIHLVSNSTAAIPLDVWKPSGKYVAPATADQVAFGYFRNFKDNRFEASAEVYYKDFDQLLDYVDGAELLLNEHLEQELLSGEGRAYGLELQVKKKQGKMTGWVSYTLGRTERQVDGINNDEYYPSNYDKMHDISVVWMYEINEKWDISANFAFMSGRPITYPDGKYEIGNITVPNYSNRNGARTPSYHRLDFTANLTPLKNKDRKWKGSWNFSVYNLYSRRNPYSIFFRQNEDNPQITEGYQLSILGSFFPSVGYNFKF